MNFKHHISTPKCQVQAIQDLNTWLRLVSGVSSPEEVCGCSLGTSKVKQSGSNFIPHPGIPRAFSLSLLSISVGRSCVLRALCPKDRCVGTARRVLTALTPRMGGPGLTSPFCEPRGSALHQVRSPVFRCHVIPRLVTKHAFTLIAGCKVNINWIKNLLCGSIDRL